MLDGLRLAVGTLTAIPVAPPRRVDRRVAGRAMTLAPPVVLPFALAVLALHGLEALVGAPAPVLAVLALAVLVLGTRAMHLDGLADTADGLSASYDRERALQVMRRGDIGPSGVAAVTLVLLLDAAALASLLPSLRGSVLAVVALVVQPPAAGLARAPGAVPPARADGLGATVAGSVTPAVWALSTAVTAVLAVGAGLAADLAWWAGPVVLAAAVAGGALVLRRAVVRLGGHHRRRPRGGGRGRPRGGPDGRRGRPAARRLSRCEATGPRRRPGRRVSPGGSGPARTAA